METAETLATVTHTHTHTHTQVSLLTEKNCTLVNQSVVVLSSKKNKKDKIENSFKKHIA